MATLYLIDSDGNVQSSVEYPPGHPFSTFKEDPDAKAIRKTPCFCMFCGGSMPWGTERSFGICTLCRRNSSGKSLIDGTTIGPKYRHDGSTISRPKERFEDLKSLKREISRKLEDILTPAEGVFDPKKSNLFELVLDLWMDTRKMENTNFTDGLESERDRIAAINLIYVSTFNNWEQLQKEGLESQIYLIEAFVRAIDF